MKKRVRQFIALLFFFAAGSAKAQSVVQVFSNSGIWADYSPALSYKTYPKFKGRLTNINWSDIELAPNVWDWTIFDKDIVEHIADSLPVIFMVYTRMNAPAWIFSNGVPKVSETNGFGVVTGYSPYYLDADYNFYFKRMITKVREHVVTLQPSIRNKIIGVQPCFGSTGDQIAYKGYVAKQYEITDTQLDSLFKVYSLYYYNEYKNLTPKIAILSNPEYQDPAQQYWLNDNCPGGWTKCGTMGKGFQLNMELDKRDWLFDIMNKPWNGEYIKSRSEIWGQQLDAGWWTKNNYKSMFALMCYCVYWGLDWPNERNDLIQNPKYDSAFKFFDKYAGQKVPRLSKNAVCVLKDVLDASDVARFPENIYGNADRLNKTRYINIYNSFVSYGAKLEDPSVITGSEYDCLAATGTNDVGWRLLPGNYERYLHQIDANITSAGYWNQDGINPDVMYGRFARGFDLAKGKDALYFDVENGFLKNTPLNGAYPATIEVTYYDNGTGSWQLFYDAQSSTNKPSLNIICGNTKTWKKTKIVLTDAYFGNRSTRNADFYIKSTGSSNVVFSVVELSRPEQSPVGFITSPLTPFDTVCVNAVIDPKAFVLNAAYLNGTNVQVGPLSGYTFAKSANGPYSNSLTYSGYGNQINATIYVKINTATGGIFNSNIPITGGGVASSSVGAVASVLNTSPILNASITPISCPNKNDGSIDLQPIGGIGPFTYQWSSSAQQFWSATTQDIGGLRDANYTVVVTSSAGCTATKTFSITQPDKLTQPSGINGPSSAKKQQSGVVFSVINPNSSLTYIWTVPSGASITSGQNSSSITVKWGNSGGNVTVKAKNNCTTSSGTSKYVSATSSLNVGISSSSMEITSGTDKVINRQMIVMPNPVKDIANLRFYAVTSFSYAIEITDVRGKVLLAKKGAASAGTNVERLNVQTLANGQYFVTLINNTKGEKQTLKLMKQ